MSRVSNQLKQKLQAAFDLVPADAASQLLTLVVPYSDGYRVNKGTSRTYTWPSRIEAAAELYCRLNPATPAGQSFSWICQQHLNAQEARKPKAPNSIPELDTKPLDQVTLKALRPRLEVVAHEVATKAARAQFLAIIRTTAGNLQSYLSPAIPISIDYALLKGAQAYLFAWVKHIRSVDGDDSNHITLDSAEDLRAISALLSSGIPLDFAYNAEKQALYTSSEKSKPFTGTPVTPDEAAYMYFIRPPSWIVSWEAPTVSDYTDTNPFLAECLNGVDPTTHNQFNVPAHVNKQDLKVLTVPEAFRLWMLYVAAASNQIDIANIPVLSIEDAAARAFTLYPSCQKAWSITSPRKSYENQLKMYNYRLSLGQPEAEVIADLGPRPELPPLLKPSFVSYARQLKAATTQVLPQLENWFSQLDRVLAEPTVAANCPKLLPPASEIIQDAVITDSSTSWMPDVEW